MQTPAGLESERAYSMKIWNLVQYLQRSFELSSSKDQPVGLVHESLVQSLWSSCLSELDSWSDERKFHALELLVAIIPPDDQVSVVFSQLDPAEAVIPQYETISPANQDFLVRLKTRCDSVLHTYLSKIAGTPAQRNYLHVLYTAAAADVLRLGDSEASLNKITEILQLHPPTFQPCGNPYVLLDATNHWKVLHRTNYLRDFLLNPERSKIFHYDSGLWSAIIVARYIKYLERVRGSYFW